MITRTMLETAKSTRETSVDETGKISLGKKTLLTRLALLVSELTAKRSEEARKFHAARPQYANIGYGTSVEIGATLVKMTENTAVFTSGMNTAQPNPITVCL